MARLVLNRDGGKTDEFGHILGLSRFLQGEVIEGLDVTAQSSPNMSVKVSAGSAKIPYGTGGTRYAYWVANDADYSVTIATADPANPRIDYIIGVVDRTVTPSTGVTNNSNNMFKIIAVAGTPAASPSVPSGTQLQTAAGTGNPYILLRRLNVPAGVTQITSAQISTDLRTFAYPTRNQTNDYGMRGDTIYMSASGTYSKPAGLKYVIVELVGGGGAGGGAATTSSGNTSAGSGGGAGGYSIKKILASSLSANEAVTIGSGGTGVSGNSGNSGGSTSFGSHLSATGGNGGYGGASLSDGQMYAGGAGGAGSGGYLNSVGGQGGEGGRTVSGRGYGGMGGTSYYGAGGEATSGTGSTQALNGSPAVSYGSGGGGGLNSNPQGSTRNGGAGKAGLVVVTEYF